MGENYFGIWGGVKNALAKIAQKPEILGKMQGVGLGRILAFSKKRLVATSNSYILSERLALYEEYKEKIPNIRHDLEKGKYEEKIFELSSKIKKLEKALPSTQLEAFIQEAHMMSDIHSKPKELEVIKSMIFWAKKSSFSFIPVPHSVIPAKVGIQHYDSWITAFAGMTSGIQPKFSFDDVSQNLHQRHIEGIFRAYIHSINPYANIEKKGKRIKAGSLEMNLENGLWHRFSTNQGGNIFGFVTEATGLNKKSALEIVAEYAGVGGVPVSSPRTVIVRSLKSDAAIHPCQWIAQSTKRSGRNDGYAGITMMAKAPEFEPKKHIAYLLKTNNLDSIYTYKNMDGEIIGHTIRLINKATGSKQVIPASFCHNKALDKSEWRLKGFLDESDSKPIYGRETLQNNLKPVLIVEGEKTSDKASKLFPEYIVVSWLGGAQNADKVNWSILARNQVVIWPDFDKPGIIAARIIANRVKVPFGSISIVDVSNLGLPAKWDLGDELPHGMSMEDIRTSITDAQYKYSITGFVERMLDPDIQEIEKRILLQNRISGFILHEKELAASIQLENKIHAKLASDEAISYIKYATARSITDSDHEFLSLYHELYKDTLIEIAKANINKIDLEQNIPDLLNDLQKEYSRQKGSFTAHLSYIKPYSNTEKTELSTILLRDILLLHEMQMSSKLSDLHKEIIAKNIYKIVDSSKDHDKLKLASEAYHQCSNSSFWSDLLEVTFDIEISRDKFELIKPIEADLDMGFGVKKLAIKNIDRSLEKE